MAIDIGNETDNLNSNHFASMTLEKAWSNLFSLQQTEFLSLGKVTSLERKEFKSAVYIAVKKKN